MNFKLKGEILSKRKADNIGVICCHDTDVFELAKKPPVDWYEIKKEVESLGIKQFHQVKAHHMIEDWFLADMTGIRQFLRLKDTKRAIGHDGNEKLKKLFKIAGKLYIKGSSSKDFIRALNIETIRKHALEELNILEELLGVNIPPLSSRNKKST